MVSRPTRSRILLGRLAIRNSLLILGFSIIVLKKRSCVGINSSGHITPLDGGWIVDLLVIWLSA